MDMLIDVNDLHVTQLVRNCKCGGQPIVLHNGAGARLTNGTQFGQP